MLKISKSSLVVFVLLLIAFLNRLTQISYPKFLWEDERGYTLFAVHFFDENGVLDRLRSGQPLPDPPVAILFLAIFFQILNYSIALARTVSAVFGVLTIFYIYLIGRIIKDEKVGIVAVLLMAVEPHHVIWSRQFSPYILMLFFMTAGFYHFIKALSVREVYNTKCSKIHQILSMIFFIYGALSIQLGIIAPVTAMLWLFYTEFFLKSFREDKRYVTSFAWISLIIVIIFWYLWNMMFITEEWKVASVVGMGGLSPLLYLKVLPERYLGISGSLFYVLLITASILTALRETSSSKLNIPVLLFLICFFTIFGLVAIYQWLLITKYFVKYLEPYALINLLLKGGISSYILLGLLLKILKGIQNAHESLPHLWVICSLAGLSTIVLKNARYLIVACGGFELSMGLLFSDFLNNYRHSTIWYYTSLLLLVTCLIHYTYVDFATPLEDYRGPTYALWWG